MGEKNTSIDAVDWPARWMLPEDDDPSHAATTRIFHAYFETGIMVCVYIYIHTGIISVYTIYVYYTPYVIVY